jgi:hypothetical protein
VLFSFDNIGLKDLVFFAGSVLVLVGMAFYIWRLETENANLRYQQQAAQQRQAALKDSLRKINTYEDSTGLRSLFARLDLPTQRPDTLGEDPVPGETEERTDVQIDPAPDSAALNAKGLPPSDSAQSQNGLTRRWELNERIGRYRLGGTVEVNRRTGGLTYDLRIDGAPINLTVYKTQTDGRRQTVVDAPDAAPVTGLQGRYRPERKPEFPNWALRAPFVAYRPSVGQPGLARSAFALGVTLTRRAQIPLGAIAFMEVGMAATPPITNPQARPVLRGGIEWTF